MEKDFEAFRADLASVIRQNDAVCKEGYKALLSSSDYIDLVAVIRKYWAELNRLLWPQFQQLLFKHYDVVGEELERLGFCYNTFCSSGLCVVDGKCLYERLLIRGKADVVCHDNSKVRLSGQAHALLLDESDAVATEVSTVDARGHSLVEAQGYCTVRAFEDAKVVSDGATQLYLYDNVQAKIVRYRRLEFAPSATILSPFTDFR